MPDKAILFYNPNSGRYHAEQIAEWIGAFSENGLNVKAINNPEELRNLPPTHIIAAGGDGTLHVALNSAGLNHTFSILPVGSGNDFAANFKKLSIAELAQKILSSAVTRYDVINVNGIYAHNVCGTGFESFIAGKARKIRWPALKYILPIVRYMFFYKPISAKITADDFIYDGQIFMITIGNGYRSGGGFKVFPMASLQDGKIDMVLIKPHNILQRLWYVFMVNFGMHLQLKPVVFSHVNTCKIELEYPYPFQADGDLYQAKIINVEVIKDGMVLIV
jgi:YegS/Rv2252/BmrU family lipid kinase